MESHAFLLELKVSMFCNFQDSKFMIVETCASDKHRLLSVDYQRLNSRDTSSLRNE